MQKKYKTLLSNTLLISMGTFGSKLLVFFMVRFYTEYLTPSDYSTADLITQTANLLFPIISVGITEGVFRFAMDSTADRKSVFTYGLGAILVGSLLFFGVAPLLNLVNDFSGFVWLIVVYTLACCLHSLCAQYIRAIGKTALFAGQGIVNTLMVIVLNIIFLSKYSMGVTGYVLSVAVADTLCTLFLVVKERLWKNITFSPNKKVLPALLKYSIPLIPTTVFWWITSVSDRYMVNGFIGSQANGLYTVSYKLPTLLTLVSTIFMQAWQFSAVTESEGDKHEYSEFYSKVWRSFQAVMFLAGSAVILVAKPATKLLTAKEFYGAWEYVPLLSVAMVFTAFTSFVGTVYVVTKKSGLSFLTAMLGAGSNLVLNFLLIPSPLGVQGAALATVASYVLVFIVRTVNSQKYIPFKFCTGHIIFNSIIIFIQAAVMILGIKHWVIIQIICFLAMVLINFRFIIGFAEKILSSFLGGKKK